jgi:hypothetical protein
LLQVKGSIATWPEILGYVDRSSESLEDLIDDPGEGKKTRVLRRCLFKETSHKPDLRNRSIVDPLGYDQDDVVRFLRGRETGEWIAIA